MEEPEQIIIFRDKNGNLVQAVGEPISTKKFDTILICCGIIALICIGLLVSVVHSESKVRVRVYCDKKMLMECREKTLLPQGAKTWPTR